MAIFLVAAKSDWCFAPFQQVFWRKGTITQHIIRSLYIPQLKYYINIIYNYKQINIYIYAQFYLTLGCPPPCQDSCNKWRLRDRHWGHMFSQLLSDFGCTLQRITIPPKKFFFCVHTHTLQSLLQVILEWVLGTSTSSHKVFGALGIYRLYRLNLILRSRTMLYFSWRVPYQFVGADDLHGWGEPPGVYMWMLVSISSHRIHVWYRYIHLHLP